VFTVRPGLAVRTGDKRFGQRAEGGRVELQRQAADSRHSCASTGRRPKACLQYETSTARVDGWSKRPPANTVALAACVQPAFSYRVEHARRPAKEFLLIQLKSHITRGLQHRLSRCNGPCGASGL